MYSALKAASSSPVVDGAGHGLAAVHLGQGEDLTQMHAGVHAPRLQPLAVGLRARRQRQVLDWSACRTGVPERMEEELSAVQYNMAILVLPKKMGLQGRTTVHGLCRATLTAWDQTKLEIPARHAGISR